MTTMKTKVLVCPYCGDAQAAGERCRVCGGIFEPLSRQASHNAMGPWFMRDERRPFQPGASYETIVKLVERGLINKYSILRGPTTKQFWTVARRVPGISHLLGYCHNCDANVNKDDHGCPTCGVPFGAYLDRNYLGLPEVKPLPWEAPVIDEGRQRVAATMPAPSPMIDFRRAAEPLGLSSFASDDELRGMASRPAPTYPSATTSIASNGASNDASNVAGELHDDFANERPAYAPSPIAAPAQPAPSAGQGPSLDSVNSVAARAMQRRLQNQQQTIRLLMLAVGAVTLLAIAAIVTIIVRSGRAANEAGGANGGANAVAASTQPGAMTPTSNDASKTNAQPSDATAEHPNASTAKPLDANAPATSIPADELVTPAADGSELIRADHEKAVGLMIDAKKEDRPLKSRIRAAEEAAALFKAIKQKAPTAQRPKALDEEIAEADRLVEKLKLQEFFP